MPGISIVIACRDEADTLWFTLHSLQMHTRGPLVERDGMEIVVADNHPGAKTGGKTVEEVCAGFAKARFPVRYLAAGEVKSVYFPRNQGAAAAQGEHLIFLDSHVLLTPDTIEALHRLFLNRSGLHTHAVTPDLYLAHIPIAFSNPSRLFGPYKLRLRDDFWGEWTPMSQMPQPTNGNGLKVAASTPTPRRSKPPGRRTGCSFNQLYDPGRHFFRGGFIPV